jgi:glucose/arabinose dehydrogenase
MTLTSGKLAIAVAFASAALVAGTTALAQELKHYDSNTAGFWKNPPPDWFLGDETEAQKGLSPPNGPATGMSHAEIEAALKNIKLPPGFKISIYSSGVNGARQMAWGDKGTLFVGSWFGIGSVYAITDKGGKKDVKVVIKGLTVPTGIAFRDGALYVADINKIMKYENAEANLDHMPAPKVVYDDMPPYVAHGWKYLAFDKAGWLYVPFGPPCNECLPPTSV